VFEDRVLRRMLGPKRDEITGDWRKLHNEELNDLYSLPNIFWVIKSRRMRWVGYVVCTGERRGAYRVLVGELRERDHLEDLGIDRKIILRWIFRKWDGGAWTGLIWLSIQTDGRRL
jgi:hypothetical protein